MSYLQARSEYEERYDKITVELCRLKEQIVTDTLGERPSLDSDGEADPENGYYIYSIFYFQFVESLAGERWQEREEKIREWMTADEEKDQRLAEAKPSATPYCRSCGEEMEITSRSTIVARAGRKTRTRSSSCSTARGAGSAWLSGRTVSSGNLQRLAVRNATSPSMRQPNDAAI